MMCNTSVVWVKQSAFSKFIKQDKSNQLSLWQSDIQTGSEQICICMFVQTFITSDEAISEALGKMGPLLFRSQSEALFLVGSTQQHTKWQMVVGRECGAIYSKQILYPWQVMGSTRAQWPFNNGTPENVSLKMFGEIHEFSRSRSLNKQLWSSPVKRRSF